MEKGKRTWKALLFYFFVLKFFFDFVTKPKALLEGLFSLFCFFFCFTFNSLGRRTRTHTHRESYTEIIYLWQCFLPLHFRLPLHTHTHTQHAHINISSSSSASTPFLPSALACARLLFLSLHLPEPTIDEQMAIERGRERERLGRGNAGKHKKGRGKRGAWLRGPRGLGECFCISAYLFIYVCMNVCAH